MKKIISMICLIALTLALFTGCGKDDEKKESDSSNTTNQTTDQTPRDKDSSEKSQEKVTLRFSWWGGDARHQGTLDMIELYQDLNPHVEIVAEYGGWDGYYQKLTTQLAGGTAPDIMQIDQPWIYEFNKNSDLFADLNSLTGVIDLSTFNDKFINDFSVTNGKVVGLPTGVNGLTIIKNDDALSKAGINVNENWDWNKLLSEGKKFHQQGDEYYLLSNDVGMINFGIVQKYVVQKTGKQFITDDYTLGFSESDLAEAYSYLVELIDNGVLMPISEVAAYEGKVFESPKWINGQVGMVMNWASTIAAHTGNCEGKVTVARFPVDSGTKNTGITVRPSQLIAINNNSAHVEEAAKFLEFFFNSEEAALKLGTIRGVPASSKSKDVLVGADKITSEDATAIELALDNAGIKQSPAVNNQEVEQLLKDMVQRVAFKSVTPEKGAKDLIEDLTDLLEEIQ